MYSPNLLLLTKPECHLCQDAREVVGRVAGELGIVWSEESIVDDPELSARYAEEIPVLLIDGVPRDFWRIDEVRLRRLLGTEREQ
ncbi:glutaredoxin family protein [Arthrobacter roseus]|uniref:glutaredoxin family protein n=1 Tax=Arthrobacter roseus TaxID=136274 RepID=UPI0019667F55|nr:glutaredoxin family protein [Arthrobacter roseus]MBM7849523.1 hypothetical protein [Arthrobacter roseus]